MARRKTTTKREGVYSGAEYLRQSKAEKGIYTGADYLQRRNSGEIDSAERIQLRKEAELKARQRDLAYGRAFREWDNQQRQNEAMLNNAAATILGTKPASAAEVLKNKSVLQSNKELQGAKMPYGLAKAQERMDNPQENQPIIKRDKVDALNEVAKNQYIRGAMKDIMSSGYEGFHEMQQKEPESSGPYLLTTEEYKKHRRENEALQKEGRLDLGNDVRYISDKGLKKWTNRQLVEADKNKNIANQIQKEFTESRPAYTWGSVVDLLEEKEGLNVNRPADYDKYREEYDEALYDNTHGKGAYAQRIDDLQTDEDVLTLEAELDSMWDKMTPEQISQYDEGETLQKRNAAAQRRQDSTERADDFFNYDYDPEIWGLDASQDEQREALYDRLMGDQDAYAERVSTMTPEEKAELDKRLDAVLQTANGAYTDIWDAHAVEYSDALKLGDAYKQMAQQGEEERLRREEEEYNKEQAESLKAEGYTGAYNEGLLPEDGKWVTDEEDPEGTLRYEEGNWTEVDKAYQIINTPDSMDPARHMPDTVSKYSFLNDSPDNNQVETFNIFYEYDKKNGTHKAEAYLQGLDSYLQTCKAEYQEWYAKTLADDPARGIPARALSYPGKLVTGLISGAGTIASLLGNEAAKDPNSAWYAGDKIISTMRQQQNKNIANGNSTAQYLFDLGDTVFDNALAITVGSKLGSVIPGLTAKQAEKAGQAMVQLIMSSGAAGNRMSQLLAQNMDPTEAAIYAIADGAIEWVTEKFSLEELLDPDIKMIMQSPTKRLKYLGTNILTEASEEMAADVLNDMTDSVLSSLYGHETELMKEYNALRANGMGDTEASRQVLGNHLQEIAMSGLGGGISGGFLSGGRMAVNTVSQIGAGKNIKANNSTNQLLEIAAGMKEGTQSRSMAEDILSKKGKPSSVQLGSLAQLMVTESSEQTQEVVKDTLQRQIGDELTDRGVENPKEYAQIITNSLLNGGKMGMSDRTKLAKSREAIDVWTAYQQSDSLQNARAQVVVAKNIQGQQSIIEQVGDLTANIKKATGALSNEINRSMKAAAGNMTAAIDDFRQKQSNLMSEQYANLAKELLESDKAAKNSRSYLEDAMKVRLAAMTLNDAIPRTGLSEETAQKLYDAAKDEFEEADALRIRNQVKVVPGQGIASFEGAEYGTQAWTDKLSGLTKIQRNQMGALGEIAVRTGNRINFINDTNNTGVYGFEQDTGTITINIAGLNRGGAQHHMLVTMSHEMTHWLEQNSVEGYKALRSFVLNSLRSKGENVEDLIVKTINNQNAVLGAESGSALDINGAMAEIVAKSCENLLSSKAVEAELAKTNPSLHNKIKQFVKNFVARIRAAVNGMTGSLSREARALYNETEQIAEIWLGARQEALNRETGTGAEAAEESVSYSIVDKNGNVYTLTQEQIEQNKVDISTMQQVAVINENRFTKDPNVDFKTKATDYVKSIGNKAVNDIFGDVTIDVKGIEHLIVNLTARRAGMLPAVKAVIEKGSIIDISEKGQHHAFDSAIIAAPVSFLGDTYYMGVVIKQSRAGNSYYMHDAIIAMKKDGSLPVIKSLLNYQATGSDPSIANILLSIPEYNGNSGKVSYSVADLDARYEQAVKDEDWKTAEQMLLDKYQQEEKNLVGYIAKNNYSGEHEEIAKKIKVGDPEAIRAAAEDMAKHVPDNAVLIPMPPHTGTVTEKTDTMLLARAISELTGRPVINALGSDEHISRKIAKEKAIRMQANEMGFRQIAEIPADAMPVFVDNVVGGGVTAKAAHDAVGRGITLAYAQSARSKIKGAKNLIVTYQNGNTIPLSERLNADNKSWKYSVADMRLAELEQAYEDAYNAYDDATGEEIVAEMAERAMTDSVVRDENGKLKVVYHQTNADPFTVFNMDRARQTFDVVGAFFAPEFDQYHEYGDRTYAVYLNITNPKYDVYDMDFSKENAGLEKRNELIAQGYDGVINTEDGKVTEYVAFYPEQIKSAEAFTEDDDGDLINLIQRFNKWSPDIRFSVMQSPDMEVDRFMMGLNEHHMDSVQERTMLEQYKGLHHSVENNRYFMREQEKELQKLAEKEKKEGKLSTFDRNERIKITNRLGIYQDRLERAQQELVKVTGEKGYARQMMKMESLVKNLYNGITADQLITLVDTMSRQLDEVNKEMQNRAEKLSDMAQKEAVLRIRTQFNQNGLKRIALRLKSEMNSELETKEIENRLALIALKMKEGKYDAQTAEELTDLILGKMQSNIDSYVLNTLRGRKIALSPAQLKELKATNSSLREVNAELAGTGVRIVANGGTNLEHIWGELSNEITSLDPDTNPLNQLDALMNVIRSERNTIFAERFNNESVQATTEAVLNAAAELVPEIVTDEKSLKLIKETLQFVGEISGQAKETAGEIGGMTAVIDRLKKTGAQARGKANELTGNISEALRYFNDLSEQSEAAMWKRERIRLIEQMKSEKTEALLDEQAKWKEKIEKDKAAREKMQSNMQLRQKINTNVNRIRKLLINETDVKNIPEHMKSLARAMLSKIVDNDLIGRKISGIDRKDLLETRRVLEAMSKIDGDFTLDDLRLINDAEAQSMVAEALADIEDGIRDYNTKLEGKLQDNLQKLHDNLQRISDAVSTITSVINAERSLSFLDRRLDVADAAEIIRKDMESSRFKGERAGFGAKQRNMVNSAVFYGNMTPVYYFKMLRNQGMDMLWDDMQQGENRSGLETQKAKAYLQSLADKTGYRNWEGEKHEVVLGGKKMQLTIGNMMELYAIWKREQTTNPEMSQHLAKGGVYIQDEDEDSGKPRREKKEQRAVRVSDDEIKLMYDQMTDAQKEYIEGIVSYLSNDMSRLGNEASMRMYGIEKYKESYYFPMKVWDGVKSARSDKGITGTDENRAAHRSWSKRRTHMASNALVIGDFTADAVNHIVEMINYNTMAPAIENVNKVLNYQFEEGELIDDSTKRNLRIMFQEAYGKEALRYLETFMNDLNGGVTQDQRKTLRDKALTIFKKNAVAGSMSVVLQQPLSYIRAATMIKQRYLTTAPISNWKNSYREMMEHSGVGVIKEMGRFDMNFGQSAKDWITPDTKGNVYEWLSDKTTILPQLADRMTWTWLWSAVKAEQKAQHPNMDVTSDKFLDIVGQRFNEVMRQTQVYDSILVKSSNMRSQRWELKLLTSFMAEPTLSLNLLADAVGKIRAGDKGAIGHMAKAGATFLLSAVMQAFVKGLMSSGRTPDDKKTWMENFLNKFQYNLMNEANIASLIPGYSDLIEVLKTGKLQDDAMGAVGKLFSIIQTGQNWANGKGKGTWRDLEDTVFQFAQLFSNIPMKNISRDVRAMRNWLAQDTYAKRENSAAVIKYQAEANLFTADNLLGTLNAWLGEAGFKTTNKAYYGRLYEAQKSGDKGTEQDLRDYLTLGKGVTEDTISNNLKTLTKADSSMTTSQKIKALREKQGMKDTDIAGWITKEYKEGRLTKTEAAKLFIEANPAKTTDDAYFHFEQAEWEKTTGINVGESDYFRLDAALQADNIKDYNAALKELKDHGHKEEKILEHVINDKIMKRYKDGTLNRKQAEAALKKYGQMKDLDIWWKLDRVDYQKETGAEKADGYYYRLKDAVNANKTEQITKAVKDLLNHGITKDKIKTELSRNWRQEYLAADSKGRIRILDAITKAYKAAGYKAEDAKKTVENWIKDSKKKKK